MNIETDTHETAAVLPPSDPTDGSDHADAEGAVELDDAHDDMTLAAEFIGSVPEAGRLGRYSTKDLLWEYGPDRGVWHRVEAGEAPSAAGDQLGPSTATVSGQAVATTA